MKMFIIFVPMLLFSSCSKDKIKVNLAGKEIKNFEFVQDENGNCFISYNGYGATHYSTVKPEDCK